MARHYYVLTPTTASMLCYLFCIETILGAVKLDLFSALTYTYNSRDQLISIS